MIRTRTKIEAVLAVAFLLAISISSVFAVTRTISDTGDTIYTKIICSNGNVYDATAANIQIAIWSLNSSSGGEVSIPIGTFNLTKDLQMKSGIWLHGIGAKTILRQASTTTFTIGVIYCYSINNWTISDMTIDGNNLGITDGYNAISISASYDFIVRDMHLKQTHVGGISVVGYSKRGLITNIIGMDLAGTGQILSINDVNQTIFSNIICYNSSGTAQAVDFVDIIGCTISDITINKCYMAMKVSSTSTFSYNNTFNNLIFQTVNAAGEGIKIEKTKKSTFNNMFIDGGTSSGLLVASTCSDLSLSNLYTANSANNGLTISGNNITVNNAQVIHATAYGLYVTGDDCSLSNIDVEKTVSYNLIENAYRDSFTGCRISGGSNYGIVIKTSRDVSFTGCSFISNTDGFTTSGAGITNLSFSNCQFLSNSGKGIHFASATDTNMSVIGCLFRGNGDDGIEADCGDSVIIMGCIMWGDSFDDNIVGNHNVTGTFLNIGMTTI